MKTAQFTPGPWAVKSTDEDINTKTIVDGTEFWIARVLNFNHASDDIRESRANATLIAAAPTMYEALKEWCDYYAAYNPIRDKRIEPFIQLTRKALAQAEGRQG